jgi:hypothetical protein
MQVNQHYDVHWGLLEYTHYLGILLLHSFGRFFHSLILFFVTLSFMYKVVLWLHSIR